MFRADAAATNVKVLGRGAAGRLAAAVASELHLDPHGLPRLDRDRLHLRLSAMNEHDFSSMSEAEAWLMSLLCRVDA
jgi:hypothetical protein